jgi:hypothetical protein
VSRASKNAFAVSVIDAVSVVAMVSPPSRPEHRPYNLTRLA